MSAQRGKDLLVKIGDGGSPETFTTVAGLRATTLSFNAQTVDVTNADSVDQWRELLAGAGVKSASFSGSGVFKDAASDESLHASFFNQTTPNFQIVIPGFGTISGAFPPNSSRQGLRFRAARTATIRPTRVDPVKLMRLMAGWSINAPTTCPASSGALVTTPIKPLGRPPSAKASAII